MSTATLNPPIQRSAQSRDRLENFHGNQLLYVLWERHLTICAPIALALPASTTWGEFRDKVLLGTVFSQHPEWSRIAWDRVRWETDGHALAPQDHQTLADLGLEHKSLLRMRTPELAGIGGVGG